MVKQPVKSSSTPTAKDTPIRKRCTACYQYVSQGDQHELCPGCRKCSAEAPCLLDRHWLPEQWAAHKEVVLQRLAARARSQANLSHGTHGSLPRGDSGPGCEGKIESVGKSKRSKKGKARDKDRDKPDHVPSATVEPAPDRPESIVPIRPVGTGSGAPSTEDVLSGTDGRSSTIPFTSLPGTVDPGSVAKQLTQRASPDTVSGWVTKQVSMVGRPLAGVVGRPGVLSPAPPTMAPTMDEPPYGREKGFSSRRASSAPAAAGAPPDHDGAPRAVLASPCGPTVAPVDSVSTGTVQSNVAPTSAAPTSVRVIDAPTSMVQASTVSASAVLSATAPVDPRQGGRLSDRALQSHRQLPPPRSSQTMHGRESEQPMVSPAAVAEALLNHPAFQTAMASVTGFSGVSAGAAATAPPVIPSGPLEDGPWSADTSDTVPQVPCPVRIPFPGPLSSQGVPPESQEESYEDEEFVEGDEDEFYEEEYEGDESWDGSSLVQEQPFDSWRPSEHADPAVGTWQGLPSGSFPPVSGPTRVGTGDQDPLVVNQSPLGSADIRSTAGSSFMAPQSTVSSVGSWVPPLDRAGTDYLSSHTLGPYVARVLESLGQKVTFDPSVIPSSGSGDLGFLNPVSARRGPAHPVPEIPLSGVVRDIVAEVMNQAVSRESVVRDPVVQRIAPVSGSDRDLLSTPMCPESCFRLMEQDLNSRCVPIQPVPAGVEGEGQRRRLPPRRVAGWNRDKDAELRRTEDLARDGIRLANLQSYILAHLLNALTNEDYVMRQSDRVQTVETLKELQHMSTRHFSLIAAQSLVSRRACAANALNFPDRRVLMGAPIGASLFGDRWDQLLQTELTRRQETPPPPKRSRKRKRGSMDPPAPQAPLGGARQASYGGRSGRGDRGRAPAALGAPVQQALTVQQLAAVGISVQQRGSSGPPVRHRGQRGGGHGRGQRGGSRGRGNAQTFWGQGRGQRRGGRGLPRGGSQPSA